MEKRLVRRSKELSWLLRHGAGGAGVPMGPAGWVDVHHVLGTVQLSRAELEEVVRHNTKQRLQLDGDRIRCCQGHSTNNMPVTLEALEASWEEVRGSAPLFHGTYRKNLASIAKTGLAAVRRTHVHLTDSLDSHVGKRASVDVALEIDPSAVRGDRLRIFRSPNGVILVRRIPRRAIIDLRPLTSRARNLEPELRAILGLD